MPIYKMEGKKDGLQKYRVRINYTDRDGKSKQLDRVAYGKENAKELERQLNHDMKSGETVTSRMTVQQLYDEYIAVKANEIRETTLRTHKGQLERHVLPCIKDVRLDKLNTRTLQCWKQSVEQYRTEKGAPFSIDYKQSIYKTFNTMLKYAVNMEYIAKNPLPIVGNFKDAYSAKPQVDFYMPDEFKKFIEAAKKCAEKSNTNIFEWNFFVFFNIAFYTGMRKGEIHALRWNDIDGNIIHVCRSISQKVKGEDRETPPKSKSSIRDIQIPLPLLKILDDHKSRCVKLEGFSEDWHICGGERCLRDTTIEKRNIAYAKKAEVKHIRIHDFRHSHVSVLANNGINIQEIARRLGHSDVQVTWNVYAHLYPKEEERAVSILNNI